MYLPVYTQINHPFNESTITSKIVSNVTSKIIFDRLQSVQDFTNVKINSLDLDRFIFSDTNRFYELEYDEIQDSIYIEGQKYIFYSFTGLRLFYYKRYWVGPRGTKHHFSDLSFGQNRRAVISYKPPYFSYLNSGVIAIPKGALNRFGYNILFISGAMFLDDIKRDFFINNFSQERKMEYINLKYRNMNPIILSKTKNRFIFKTPNNSKFEVILRRNLFGKIVERINLLSTQDDLEKTNQKP
jgi:hypothetical protein